MKRLFAFLLFSIFFFKMGAQGYVPKVGETIMFYSLTERAKQEFLGYDCFYDASKANSGSKYSFKDNNRYKLNKKKLTPFYEIEEKTFKVLKSEYYMDKGKNENKVFLLFLSCVEDDSELILRVPFFEKNVNVLTKNLVCEKFEDDYSETKQQYLNLPCIPSQYVSSIKDKYQGEELFNREVYIKNDLGINDYKGQKVRREEFSNISEMLNWDIEGEVFDIGNVEKCIDVRFEECSISQYIHPFAICTYQDEEVSDTVRIPLTYMAGKTSFFNKNKWSNYLFENFFAVKKDEIRNIMAREQCLEAVEKYSGKDVYYGLYNHYHYNNENFNASNNINMENGTNYELVVGKIYKCLMFDVFLKKDEVGYDVYAILQDSLGVKFRVPAKMRFSGLERQIDLSSDNHYNKDFQEYFTLLEETTIQLEQRKLLAAQKEKMIREKEKMEKERYNSWVKKYGTSYADYISNLTNMQIDKFERLAPKYGKATAKMMIEGKVRIGWSKQMCKESWGEPDDINRAIGSWGTHEQWVYGDIYCDYLYFENGILTTIQN